MKPYLLEYGVDDIFPIDITWANFQSGLGVIADAENLLVHEVINGEYTFTFDVPRNSEYFDILSPDMIVKIKVRPTKISEHNEVFGLYDAFVITKTEIKSNPDVMLVTAQQYNMLANWMIAKQSISIDGKNLKDWNFDGDFNVNSLGLAFPTINIDKTFKDTGIVFQTPSFNSFWFQDENAIASLVNGRAVRYQDSFSLNPYTTENYFDIRRGKNIMGVSISKDVTTMVTSIIPYITQKDDDIEKRIYGNTVVSPNEKNYKFPRIKSIDYSNRAKTLDELNTVAKTYFTENKDIDMPNYQVNIDVNSYDEDIQDVAIGDVGRIHDAYFNLDIELPVIERTYDPDLNKTTSLKLGTPKENPFNSIQKKLNQIEKKIG